MLVELIVLVVDGVTVLTKICTMSMGKRVVVKAVVPDVVVDVAVVVA